MRETFVKLSLYSGIIFAVIMIISYFFFHFVTDDGITAVWHPEAGKPFVAELIANFGILFAFCSVVCLMIALIFFPKQKDDNNNKN